MKASYYNFIIEGEQKKDGIYYNARTGSLSYLNEEYHTKFQDFLKNKNEITDEKFRNNLVYCGFLVEDDFDEKLDIKMRMFQAKYENSVLSLTIAPTMACNFRCVYCFEQGYYENGSMTKETEQQICDFVIQEAGHLEKLAITWYGGEPLLAIQRIESLSKKFIQICEELHIEYEATMITNGYLLSGEICNRLIECKIDDVQVTIDGEESVHNKRRKLIDGSKTYENIMENIEQVCRNIQVVIRMNIDSQNMEHIKRFMEDLKRRRIYEEVFCYFAFVTETNGVCRDCNSMSNETYSKFHLQLLKENKIPLKNFYPKPIGNYCGADYGQGYVIDPKGNLYKCWSDIGRKERRIGTLGQWTSEKYIFDKKSDITHTQVQKMMSEYTMYDPTEDSHCMECKILPLCMGGCPRSRIEKKPVCDQYRYSIQEYMEAYGRELLRKRGEVLC